MRRALITGASSGIGREIALELYRRGYYIINVSRRREPKEGGEPTDKLVNGIFIRADLTKVEDIQRVIELVDGVNVIIHNAGHMNLTNDYTYEMFIDLVNSQLWAPYTITRELIERGKLARGGVVVFISSVSGIYGEPDDIPYGAVKSGMIGMAMGFARKYRGHRFVVVAPGPIRTWLCGDPGNIPREILDRVIVGRIGEPREVAILVAHIIENEFINNTVIVIDGGRL